MNERFRQSVTILLLFLLLLYVGVLFLQASGLWQLTLALIRILFQVLYGFFIAMIMEVWICRIPIQRRWLKVTIVYAMIGALIVLFLWYCIPKSILWYQELSIPFSFWKTLIPQSVVEQFLLWLPNISDFLLHQVDTISQMGFIFMSAFFISLDLHYVLKGIRYFVQIDDAFIQTADVIIFQYTKGIGLDLLFLYGMFYVLLTLFHFPESYLFAAILALLNLLPIIGPLIGWVLLIVISLFSFTSFPYVLILLLFLFQQVESNWIQPFIFKKVMQLRPIVTLISLLICGSLFGIFGMLFSPIIAGIGQLLFQSFLFTKHTKTVGSWEDVWYNFQD